MVAKGLRTVIVSFNAATDFELGDPAYIVDAYTVSNNPFVGPMVGYVHGVSDRKDSVMIVPVTVHTVKREKLVIDPLTERRAEYQALGCPYTQASDLALCDRVDEAIDGVNATIDGLGEYVDERLAKMAEVIDAFASMLPSKPVKKAKRVKRAKGKGKRR